MLEELFIGQQNHLNVCIKLNLLKGKDVLEVGGDTPEKIAKFLGVKSWTCIDPLFKKDFEGNDFYKKIKASVLDFKSTKKFDIIYATNSFEHVIGLDIAFENMYKLLKKNGYLTSLCGPIYSCYKGSHSWCYLKSGELITFNEIKLPQWAHLIYDLDEIKNMLLENYSKEDTECLLKCFDNWDFLNYLFFDDYINIVNNSKFKIIELRDWHSSHYPSEKLQKFLENKYHKKNFSTVSIKMLLQK